MAKNPVSCGMRGIVNGLVFMRNNKERFIRQKSFKYGHGIIFLLNESELGEARDGNLSLRL